MSVLKIRDENGNIIEIPAFKGEKGDKGDKGENGKDGVTPEIDQTYNPKSENAQSGRAVAEALEEMSGPGIYVGSGEMPDDCNVQIDTDGSFDFEVDQNYKPNSVNPQSGIAVAEAINSITEKYELIAEITLGEDSAISLEFDTPMKSVIITSDYIAAESGTYYWTLNDKYSSNSIIPAGSPSTSLSNTRYTVEIYFDKGILYSKTYKAQNVYLTSNCIYSVNTNAMTSAITYINKLKSTCKHLAGSKFSVYGVKA